MRYKKILCSSLGIIPSTLIIFGCAMESQKIDWTILKTPPTVTKCGDAHQGSLGIAPLVDRRPDVEKTGKEAKGLYLLVWNQKMGDYVSSDKDLSAGQNPNWMQEYAVNAINRSNCFFETKAIGTSVSTQPSVAELMNVFAKEKIEYVLVGELRHFYGRQPYRSAGYVVPAIYVNAVGGGKSVGNAEGRTEILFRLYETRSGYELWSHLAEGSESLVLEGQYAQAALQSYKKSMENLSTGLHDFVRQIQTG